jgi:hypothetical protein
MRKAQPGSEGWLIADFTTSATQTMHQQYRGKSGSSQAETALLTQDITARKPHAKNRIFLILCNRKILFDNNDQGLRATTTL